MTSQYPRWIPSPVGGAEILVKDEAQHLLMNEADYERFLNEKPATPATVQEMIASAVAIEREGIASQVADAVAAERERCAGIAVGYGGKQSASIANDIRGFKPEVQTENSEA